MPMLRPIPCPTNTDPVTWLDWCSELQWQGIVPGPLPTVERAACASWYVSGPLVAVYRRVSVINCKKEVM